MIGQLAIEGRVGHLDVALVLEIPLGQAIVETRPEVVTHGRTGGAATFVEHVHAGVPAVLVNILFLVQVEHAGQPVDIVDGFVGDQAEFLHPGLGVVAARGALGGPGPAGIAEGIDPVAARRGILLAAAHPQAAVVAVAAAVGVEIGGVGSEGGESQVPGHIQRRQLDLALGGFQQYLPALEIVVLEVGAIHRLVVIAQGSGPARAHLVLLVLVAGQHAEGVGGVPLCGQAREVDFYIVGVLLVPVAGAIVQYLLVAGFAGVYAILAVGNQGFAETVEAVGVDVVDHAVVVDAVDEAAHGEIVAHGDIGHRVEIVVVAAGAIGLAVIALDLALELFSMWLVGDIAHGAADGAGAVQGALGAAQQFHPLQVLEHEVGEYRGIVHVGGNRGYRVQGDVTVEAVVDVNAANDDAVDRAGVAVAAVHHGYAGHGPQQLGLVLDLLVHQLRPLHGRNIVGDVLDRDPARGRGDDHFLQFVGRLRQGRMTVRQQRTACGDCY